MQKYNSKHLSVINTDYSESLIPIFEACLTLATGEPICLILDLVFLYRLSIKNFNVEIVQIPYFFFRYINIYSF